MGASALTGVVRDITQDGTTVVETDAGLLMSHGALPGEQVRVRVRSKQKGVLWGEVEQILAASPNRVEPACTLAARCGGCPLMALRDAEQRALKLVHVTQAMQGVCRDGASPVFETVGPSLGYRRRVRLSFRRVGSAVLLGYRAHGTHHIVDAPACPVLEPVLQAALTQVRATLVPELSGSGELELARAVGDHAVVHVACDEPVGASAYRAAEALVAEQGVVRGVALRVQGGAPATSGDATQSSLGADGLPLRAPAKSFAQANAAVNERLCELVVELASPQGARVLELYAGHGNLTVALGRHATALDAFELDAEAADACRANLRARELRAVHVHAADAANPQGKLGQFDALVLDPPRGGAPGIAEIASRTRPARIVYVSCHMTTLGRDLRALAALGYRADRVHALDMFPQTAHVEAVVRMVREAD